MKDLPLNNQVENSLLKISNIRVRPTCPHAQPTACTVIKKDYFRYLLDLTTHNPRPSTLNPQPLHPQPPRPTTSPNYTPTKVKNGLISSRRHRR